MKEAPASKTQMSGVLFGAANDGGCNRGITHLGLLQLTDQNQVFQRAM